MTINPVDPWKTVIIITITTANIITGALCDD